MPRRAAEPGLVTALLPSASARSSAYFSIARVAGAAPAGWWGWSTNARRDS
ncbi:hypothetical protein [Kineosporia mesophila]|uniref:hypothetical protein n=1 Tax=Kineosporia mesophila TaxID=566012 RepID=UPI001E355FBA|nr:hypothetical protein [Kineosporia mesophila]MCD5351160.1 hypothetical protein [Kineosporia mesophila]